MAGTAVVMREGTGLRFRQWCANAVALRVSDCRLTVHCANLTFGILVAIVAWFGLVVLAFAI